MEPFALQLDQGSFRNVAAVFVEVCGHRFAISEMAEAEEIASAVSGVTRVDYGTGEALTDPQGEKVRR